MDFAFLLEPGALQALTKVILIDLMLAGDNAIIIGALAAGLPAHERRKVIAVGMVAALVLRIGFAIIVTELLDVVGLRLAGGLLLLWVCWKMYRELRPHTPEDHEGGPALTSTKTFLGAVWAVAIADVSMSLDNVLAVAGAAQHHIEVMVIGLVLSVALMGVAANYVAKVIERFQWLGWIGLGLILYVAVEMIIGGGQDVTPYVLPILENKAALP